MVSVARTVCRGGWSIPSLGKAACRGTWSMVSVARVVYSGRLEHTVSRQGSV